VTADRLSRVLHRRWYVVVCGAVFTLLMGAVVWHSGGLHYQRAEVVFGPLGTRAGFEEDLPPGGSLIPFAGAVARLAGQDQGLTYPATRAELYASGIRSGTWIRLVDTGGQWTRIHAEPKLIVEAVDPDPARTEELFAAALQRVEDATDTLQVNAAVPVGERIDAAVQHEETHYVGASRLDAARATIVVLALGTVLTVLAARGVDTVGASRRRSSRRHS
jgi:hypothetical protein